MVLLTALAAGEAFATHFETTIDRQISRKDPGDDEPFIKPRDESQESFFELEYIEGQEIVVRKKLADPQKGRGGRRRSLFYFAQLTDFQLADEESPARVEFLDFNFDSAWRPQEAFHPFAIDQSLARVNALADRSPFTQGGSGGRAKMALALLTGDQADNQQFNETLWIRKLIEPGSRLDPGSGIESFSSCDPAAQLALQLKNLKEEPNYIGVQDYEEFTRDEDYWDPEDPAGLFINWPIWRGLLDRAQEPFTTTGLKVPTYVVNGNHDSLIQGNEDVNQAFEQIAIGCVKVTSSNASPVPGVPDPNVLLSPASWEYVPPDPDRRIVSKGEVRNIFADGKQKDDHGFKFVDPAEDGDLANRGNAWYYVFNPKPGLRLIVIDTVSEGGVVGESSEGNIDDPQFQWLERELKKASCIEQPADCKPKLIIVTGHHPVRSLRSRASDENAPLCGGGYNNPEREYDGPDRDPQPGHNHAQHPGCDPDIRVSTTPSGDIHNGEDLVELLHQYPRAIAYVAGHTHENCITPYLDGDGGGFWELNTAATADYPQSHRIIDLMDNKDGTLSIFSVAVDHDSNIGLPSPGKAGDFNRRQLGSIGRTTARNDPQPAAAIPVESPPCPEQTEEEREEFGSDGRPEDRNVELVIDDPRVGTTAQPETLGGDQPGSVEVEPPPIGGPPVEPPEEPPVEPPLGGPLPTELLP